MASISKRVSGAWQNTSYGIRATATDTIATLPTTIYGDGTKATIGVYGNTIQSGTPTPDNPIMPQGTGERTGNLFDLNRLPSDTWTTDMQYYINGGVAVSKSVNPAAVTISVNNDTLSVTAKAGNGAGFLIEVKPSTGYRLAFTKSESLASDKTSCVYTLVNTSETVGQLRGIYGDTDSVAFTTESNTKYVYFVFRKAGGTISYSNIMFSEGQTFLPYEPYGYKIPISSANTTTPVYLGEVETTRKNKKLVLDGTETITEESTNVYSIPINDTVTAEAGLSTHFEYDSTVLAGQFRIEAGKAVFGYNDTLANFSTFLAAQYAAGTPVTVWYVLAAEETAVVNEPLMKIDGYADEVNNISIPTTDGANTLSVDTTVQPSEVDINYHGWHMGTVHERTSGQWD